MQYFFNAIAQAKKVSLVISELESYLKQLEEGYKKERQETGYMRLLASALDPKSSEEGLPGELIGGVVHIYAPKCECMPGFVGDFLWPWLGKERSDIVGLEELTRLGITKVVFHEVDHGYSVASVANVLVKGRGQYSLCSSGCVPLPEIPGTVEWAFDMEPPPPREATEGWL